MSFISDDKEYIMKWANNDITDFRSLSRHIREMCRDRKTVLIIDNADIAKDNRVFLEFLSMLSERYLLRESGEDNGTFHSVILAETNSKENMDLPVEMTAEPWNAMHDNRIDMSFSAAAIASMLREYEADHKTGMDITEISEELFNYTSGYLFLVSMLCKHIDEHLDKDWTPNGIEKAMNMFLNENHS